MNSLCRTAAAAFALAATAAASASLAQHAPAPEPDDAAPPAAPIAPPPAEDAPAPAAAPPREIADCAACHGMTREAPPSIGPNLWGVGGRTAGTAPDYPFSPALKAYGVVWTPETLQPYIAAPMQVVPGTTMAYPGLPDPAAARAIADYLMTLKD